MLLISVCNSKGSAHPFGGRLARAMARGGKKLRSAKPKPKCKAKASATRRTTATLQNSRATRCCHPDWVRHVAMALQDKFEAIAQKQMQLRINVWLDCGGIGTEMHAGECIAKGLAQFGIDVSFHLYGGSDKCGHATAAVQHAFAPKHWSNNILDRDLKTGRFTCVVHDTGTCQLPQGCIEMFSASFPCSPWSPRGRRQGLKDPKDGDLIWQVLDTISFMEPFLFMMENVLEITNSDDDDVESSDLDKIVEVMKKQLCKYHVIMISGVCPSNLGFPNVRKRWFCLGSKLNNELAIAANRFINLPPMPKGTAC